MGAEVKRTFQITLAIDFDDETMVIKPRSKQVSRAVREILKTHGRGYLHGLKIIRCKSSDTTYRGGIK